MIIRGIVFILTDL